MSLLIGKGLQVDMVHTNRLKMLSESGTEYLWLWMYNIIMCMRVMLQVCDKMFTKNNHVKTVDLLTKFKALPYIYI